MAGSKVKTSGGSPWGEACEFQDPGILGTEQTRHRHVLGGIRCAGDLGLIHGGVEGQNQLIKMPNIWDWEDVALIAFRYLVLIEVKSGPQSP